VLGGLIPRLSRRVDIVEIEEGKAGQGRAAGVGMGIERRRQELGGYREGGDEGAVHATSLLA